MRTAWLVVISAVAVLAATTACRPSRDFRQPYHEPVAEAAASGPAAPAVPSDPRPEDRRP
jgi:hypothetical protein